MRVLGIVAKDLLKDSDRRRFTLGAQGGSRVELSIIGGISPT